MLTLSRKIGERIMIDGGRIVVQIVAVRRGRVYVGVQAPPTIQVHREEVQARIDAGEPAKRPPCLPIGTPVKIGDK